MQVICDIETNRLNNPDVIHCIVCKDIATGQIFKFVQGECQKEFLSFAEKVDTWIGHNFIGFDAIWLRTLTSVVIDPDAIVDTLILSRLLNYNAEGGHSLEAWGERKKFPKIQFSDYENYSEEMLTYCVRDVELNYRVYLELKATIERYPDFQKAAEIEHKIAHICQQMKQDGFGFDYEKAQEFYQDISKTLQDLDDKLLKAFPPKPRLVRVIRPRPTKNGTINRTDFRWYKSDDYSIFSLPDTESPTDSAFSLIEWDPFNPGSPRQIVERLNEAGWDPINKTKGHLDFLKLPKKERPKERLDFFREFGWKVDEENLATLPDTAPEGARMLVQRILTASRKTTLESWFEAYDPKDRRIHGTFDGIGTWTHRMAHRNPNLGNVAAVKSIKYKGEYLSKLAIGYGEKMRSLWVVPEDAFLVGTDAEGIQLRIFAHYIDDPEFTYGVCYGKKEDGTDPHSLNQHALGNVCRSRDAAKTFIYAFLLGAGNQKIAEILGCSLSDAIRARDAFIERYPGLARLKAQQIPRDADRGYFQGFDGRLVKVDSEHLVLAGYLQNGEACIMKHANVLWRTQANEKRISYKQVNFVHDEWQTQVNTIDREVAEFLGQLQAEAITKIGEAFELKCPLAGKYSVGKNWLDTH